MAPLSTHIYVTDQLSIIRGKRLEKRPYFPMISLQRSCLRVSTAVYVTSDHAIELYNLKSGCWFASSNGSAVGDAENTCIWLETDGPKTLYSCSSRKRKKTPIRKLRTKMTVMWVLFFVQYAPCVCSTRWSPGIDSALADTVTACPACGSTSLQWYFTTKRRYIKCMHL